MRRLFPDAAEEPTPETIYDDLRFPVLPDRPYVLANMVASADGKAQLGSSAAGLGSRVDGAILGRLRALPDAILEGAGTIRVDRVYTAVPPPLAARRVDRGMAAQPRWGVLSWSGVVPVQDTLFHRPEPPTLLLTANVDAARPILAAGGRVEVLPLGPGPDNVRAAFAALRARYGIHSLLTEGGPTLLHNFLDLGLVDELFLTIAPKLVGGDVKTIVHGPPLGEHAAALDLVSLHEHESELYLRYRVRR